MVAPEIDYGVEETGGSYRVTAAGKPLKTPAGHALLYPTKAVAEKTAQQMADHGTQAPFYRLMSFAQEMDRDKITAELLEHFDTDLVCYPAPEPADLVAWQQKHWQPVLDWAKQKGIAPIKTTSSAAPITQTDTARKTLEAHLAGLSNVELTGVYMAGKLAGSVLTALGLAAGAFNAEQAHAIAHADELYQQQRYGTDTELEAQLKTALGQMAEVEAFVRLSR